MCLFDLDQFSRPVRVNTPTTHPTLVMGGTVLENRYRAVPHELLAGLV